MNNILFALLIALAVTFIIEHYTFPIAELSTEASIHPNQRWNFLGADFWKESSSITIDSPRVIYDADFLASRIIEQAKEELKKREAEALDEASKEEVEEAKKELDEVLNYIEERKKLGLSSLFDFVYGGDASSTTFSQVAVVALKPIVKKDGKFEALPINANLSPMPSFSLSNIISVFSVPSYDLYCSRILDIGDVEYDTSGGRKLTAYTYFVIPATPEPLPEEIYPSLRSSGLMLSQTFSVLRELISTMWRMKIDMKTNEVNMESLRTLENLLAIKNADLSALANATKNATLLDMEDVLKRLQPEKKEIVSELPSILLFMLVSALLGNFYGIMNYSYYNMTPMNAAFTFAVLGAIGGAIAYLVYTKVIKRE
jgi:hypothetical protein